MDENGHGEGGSGRMDVYFLGPKSNTFEIKVELLPFMGCQGSVNNSETNFFQFSNFQDLLKESEIMAKEKTSAQKSTISKVEGGVK